MVTPPLHARPLVRTPWANDNWLILAPHADDEILGCGALIADTASRGCLRAVVFLTDGAGSHPCATTSAAKRLAALRRHEARAAIRTMCGFAPSPIFMDWPDGQPHPVGSREFMGTADRLARLCDRCAVDAIAVTARHEPHCDHKAAYEVAAETIRCTARPVRLFEYNVWAGKPPGREFIVVKTAAISSARRKAALAQHRSQMTPLAGPGFRVPEAMRRMPSRDVLYTRRSP